MEKFKHKAPDKDAHHKLSSVAMTMQPPFSGSPLTKGGLPLILDNNNASLKQEDYKTSSGPKPGAKRGTKSHAALKFMSDCSKSPQSEDVISSSGSIAGSITPLSMTGVHRSIPDRQWPCQESDPGPGTKAEAVRQNLMLKLQPAIPGGRKDCRVPEVRYQWGNQTTATAHRDPAIPKQKTLPSVTGPAPMKPKRPPGVSLKKYQRGTETWSLSMPPPGIALYSTLNDAKLSTADSSPADSEEAAQSQTSCPFLPLSPEVLQKIHLQPVKCNRQSMLQQLEQDEYDDVAPVGVHMNMNMKALNIVPPIPPFKSDILKEEEMYDDIDVIPDGFPHPPPELSLIYDDVDIPGMYCKN